MALTLRPAIVGLGLETQVLGLGLGIQSSLSDKGTRN